MLDSFDDKKTADVLFDVGEVQTGRKTRKRAKVSPTSFYAHRFILKSCAPQLAELCEGIDDSSPVPISDVKPDIFKYLLYFVYGGSIPDVIMETNARDLIDAADVFCVVNLKMAAEAAYVCNETMTTDNVMENLLYADGKNCALLKEAAMDFLVENGEEVLAEVNLDNVPACMFRELLTATARGKKEASGEDDNDSYESMRISTLRETLYKKGVDIDGSRETLIAALKGNVSED